MGQLLSFLQVLQTNICARGFGWNCPALNNLCLLSVPVSPPILWNAFRPGRCFWRAVGRQATVNETHLSCVFCLWITLLGCLSTLTSHSLHFPRRKGLVIWPDLERDSSCSYLWGSPPHNLVSDYLPHSHLWELLKMQIPTFPPIFSELRFLWTLPRNLHCYSTSQMILMHSKF